MILTDIYLLRSKHFFLRGGGFAPENFENMIPR